MFWNVPISKELVDRELNEYHKAGVRSLYIVPMPKDFRPESIRTFLNPEYLSEEFFDLVEYTVRKAHSLGMKPWIYDEGSPTYRFKAEKLRVMTRKVDNSRLWFIFNEGEPTVTESLDISDGKRVYRIDPASGDMYLEENASPTLVCGEMAVYLVTDEIYDALQRDAEYSVEATDFRPIAHQRFIIDYAGLRNEYGDGSITPDDNFPAR